MVDTVHIPPFTHHITFNLFEISPVVLYPDRDQIKSLIRKLADPKKNTHLRKFHPAKFKKFAKLHQNEENYVKIGGICENFIL